jgi:hypothetical protein
VSRPLLVLAILRLYKERYGPDAGLVDVYGTVDQRLGRGEIGDNELSGTLFEYVRREYLIPVAIQYQKKAIRRG